MSTTVWRVADLAPRSFFDGLAPVHNLVAQVLHARGYTAPSAALAFLHGPPHTPDPFALTDMRPAVDRILGAIERDESIAVYGDYDCDGVTACALMREALRALGGRVRVYIPDRFEEGYGLNCAALDTLKAEGHGLAITVDCGARAMREAAHAKAIGLDLIITDHHGPGPGALPDALAVVNPNRHDCAYPFKGLAGVGVAHRLAQALFEEAQSGKWKVQSAPWEGPDGLLDLVAIGTVADVVPLTGENRDLVRAGLERINRAPTPGVRALLQAAGSAPGRVTANTIGFGLGPRLNAAGRLETARAAYDLLVETDEARAFDLAQRLNALNLERQKETAAVARDAEQLALAAAGAPDGPPLLFAASPAYGSGVIGLAASRLAERHHAPAVVVSVDAARGEARGSCRSVGGFHITEALDACGSLLLKHGGHAAAAGFTARIDDLDGLAERLRGIAANARPEAGWARDLHVDAWITRDDVLGQAFGPLQALEPHGMDNPRPTFAARGAQVLSARRIGKAEDGHEPPHLKLAVRLAKGSWECVAWRMGDRVREVPAGARVDLAFQLDMNDWNGQQRLQLVVQDFRAAA